MGVKVIGADEIAVALKAISFNLDDLKLITTPLMRLMKTYAHVDTGYMRKNIYHRNYGLEAIAPYAGYEEERGGSHAFGTRAIEDFDVDKWANSIVKPF